MDDKNIVDAEIVTVSKWDRTKRFAKKYGLLVVGGIALAALSYGSGKKAERKNWSAPSDDALEEYDFEENEDGTYTITPRDSEDSNLSDD